MLYNKLVTNRSSWSLDLNDEDTMPVVLSYNGFGSIVSERLYRAYNSHCCKVAKTPTN